MSGTSGNGRARRGPQLRSAAWWRSARKHRPAGREWPGEVGDAHHFRDGLVVEAPISLLHSEWSGGWDHAPSTRAPTLAKCCESSQPRRGGAAWRLARPRRGFGRAGAAHPGPGEKLPKVDPPARRVADAGARPLLVEGGAGALGVAAALVVLDEHGAVGEEPPGEPRLVVADERPEADAVVVARRVDEEDSVERLVEVQPGAELRAWGRWVGAGAAKSAGVGGAGGSQGRRGGVSGEDEGSSRAKGAPHP